jgi:hypothetical protein
MSDSNVVSLKPTRLDDLIRVTIEERAQSASEADLLKAKELANSKQIQVATISAVVAAVIFTEHNEVNRALSPSRVHEYNDAMKRGEWKLNHQGIAFYPDNTLADGQHRMAALALSGVEAEFSVFPNFQKDAIDTIDRTARRTAGEALAMMGYNDAKIKATIAKGAMEYVMELDQARRPKFSDPQIERFVIDNDPALTASIHIGRNSLKNVSDPCMGEAEAALLAQLMSMGGYPATHVVGFISSIQQGVATYPESPTVDLARQFLRAKVSEKTTDRLNKKAKMALALKGAALWTESKSVAKLKWRADKESLPTNRPPVTFAQAA